MEKVMGEFGAIGEAVVFWTISRICRTRPKPAR